MADPKLIHSVERAMEIVRMVGESEQGLTLTVIAGRLGAKLPGTHHLVATLVHSGALRREGKLLLPGEWLLRVGRRNGMREFERTAEELLLRLFEALPQCSFTCFARPAEWLLVWELQVCSSNPGEVVRPGQGLPLYVTAAGLAQLSVLYPVAPEEIERVAPFASQGLPLWGSRERLERFLELCRRRGYAESPFDTEVLWKAAKPVFSRSGRYLAVLGFGIPAAAATPEARESALKTLSETVGQLELHTIS